MKTNDILKKVADLVGKWAEGVGGAKFKKALFSKGAKALGRAFVVREVTDAISDIPIVGEALEWVGGATHAVQDAISKQTLYQIPGIKELWPTVDKVKTEILNALAPGVQEKREKVMKHFNDPKWYTSMDMHKEFNLPYGIPDNMLLAWGSGYTKAQVMFIDQVYNPNASNDDNETRISRSTALLDLLKGFRGLSGLQDYDATNISKYEDLVDYLLNEYFRLKWALCAARMVSVGKATLPRILVTAAGFNFDDFVEHRANYENLLIQLHNFISEDFPVFGMMKKRIKQYWMSLIPDDKDIKEAALIKMMPQHYATPYIGNSDSKTGSRVYGPCFCSHDLVSEGTIAIVHNQSFRPAVLYSAYKESFYECKEAILTSSESIKVRNNTALASAVIYALKSDLRGAFGATSVWSDKEINMIYDIKPKLIAAYDDLILASIHNMDIATINCAAKAGAVINTGCVGTSVLGVDINSLTGTVKVGSSSQMSATPTSIVIPALRGVAPIQATGVGKVAMLPQSIFIDNYKQNATEGENLELLQNTVYPIDIEVKYSDDDSELTVTVNYKTPTYYCAEVEVVTAPNGEVNNVSIYNYMSLTNAASAANANKVVQLLNISELCSQFNRSIFIHSAMLTGTNALVTGLDGDIDTLGSLSSEALLQGYIYSDYSLHSPDIRVSQTKRIDNIVDIYQ